MDDHQENQLQLHEVNESGSSDSSVYRDGKPVANNLRVKIRKVGELSTGEESGRNQGQGLMVPRRCNVCGKVFNSGKALGGHIRVHFQDNNNGLSRKIQNSKLKINPPKFKEHVAGSSAPAKDRDYPITNDEPTCSLCGKSFRSMKSLFGHMRCHPREWKGIRPPPAVAKNSSCSTISDAEARKVDDQIDSATATKVSSIDLLQSLKSWAIKEKRGRKSIASSASLEKQVPDGVYDLMMLANGDSLDSGSSNKKRVEVSEATNSNCRTDKAGIEDKDRVVECVTPLKKQKIEVSPVGNQISTLPMKIKIDERGSLKLRDEAGNSGGILSKKMDKGKGKALLETGLNPESVNMGTEWDEDDTYWLREDQESNIREGSDSKNSTNGSIPGEQVLCYDHKISKKTKKQKKKKNWKKKLRDSETEGDIAPKQISASPDKYECSTCNKSFSSYQALGGHRSSHNREKNSQSTDESAHVDVSAAEEEHYVNPTTKVDKTEECEEGGSRVAITEHQCNICNKTFPTGQALGGHKRSHWTAPAEAPLSQRVASPGEASQTSPKILDFDLNELPDMEDEARI